MSNHPTNDLDHARFDKTLRGHHAAALARLSPQVRAQLVTGQRIGVRPRHRSKTLGVARQLHPAGLLG